MRTIWTGDELILEFETRNIHLNIRETKELESWFNSKLKEVM